MNILRIAEIIDECNKKKRAYNKKNTEPFKPDCGACPLERLVNMEGYQRNG